MVRKTSDKRSLRHVVHPVNKLRMKPAYGTGNGYDFILLVDRHTGHEEVLTGQGQAPKNLYQKNPVHLAALEEAAKRGIYHYEWSVKRPAGPRLYQTTCVLLSSPDGRAGQVLSLSRDITESYYPYTPTNMLQDGSPAHTFAQILLATRETEKKEISKALHDEIGSSAVMLTALLSLVRASIKNGDTQQALRDIAQLDEQLKASIDRIKNVVVSLRPPSLENKGGLGGAIRDLLVNISQLGHIPYTFDYDEVDEQLCLSDNVKILLYRIVQEALTNTVKHARAKHIRVRLKQVGVNIRLSVCDDGIGFEPAQQLSIDHVGLLAMRDSVELLGGKISIKSAPGKGTRIEVSCPCIVYGGKPK